MGRVSRSKATTAAENRAPFFLPVLGGGSNTFARDTRDTLSKRVSLLAGYAREGEKRPPSFISNLAVTSPFLRFTPVTQAKAIKGIENPFICLGT